MDIYKIRYERKVPIRATAANSLELKRQMDADITAWATGVVQPGTIVVVAVVTQRRGTKYLLVGCNVKGQIALDRVSQLVYKLALYCRTEQTVYQHLAITERGEIVYGKDSI